MQKNRQTARRFSITMPPGLCEELDRMAGERGLDNRSVAITDIVRRELLNYKRQQKNRVMAGVLTISYSETVDKCAAKLSAVRREFLDEVVSCFQVMLEDGRNLEIWLVQGEVGKLERILSVALKCGNSMLGQLAFSEAVLPPLRSNQTI